MKKLLISLVIIIFWVSMASADWSVTVNWTASPDAASEVLLLDTVEQSCAIATCTFTVVNLTGQVVVIRSFNSQEAYIDYEAGTLIQTDLPIPASNAIIIITIIP